MKGRMKINVAAVLLAVVMMFLMPFKIYAAEAVTLDSAKSDVAKGNSDAQLSNYYFSYHATRTQWGATFDCVTYTFFDDTIKGKFFAYLGTANNNQFEGYIGMCYLDDGSCVEAAKSGVYTRQAWYNFENGKNYGYASGAGFGINLLNFKEGNMSVDFRDLNTNIPLFDSLDSAKAYYETGDTSGLLNGDKVSSYDPGIEVPQDLAVNFTAANFLDTSSFNKYGRFDYADSDVIFTWNQSEDVDISNYKTEIYTQLTVQWANIPYNPFSPDWHEQLASKQLVNTVDTLRSNSYTMSKSTFKDIVQKSGDEVIDGGIMGGSVSYIKEPMYFYLRNVVGNSYSDWVRVKITRDTVTTEGIPAFGNGSGTVTSGYDQVKGDSSVGGGNGQAITGDTSGGSYGKNYSVEFDSASMSGIIGFIKNGFGLLGDDGLIALFKETFSFLPAPVWTCIIAMIAASCIVVIWKVVH